MRISPRLAGIGLVVGVGYFISARLGFRAAYLAEQVTTVWAPTGIAQAALLLCGLELWPAIWFAAFITNLSVHEPLWAAAGIAASISATATYNPVATNRRCLIEASLI